MTQHKHDKRNARVMQKYILLLLALVSLTGCGLTNETHRVWDLARRTTFIEPRFYDYVRSDKLAQREARLLAEQAWAEMTPTMPNASADFQNGFTEGFADYLYRGGEGEPPLIPPRGYWNLRFLNQFGKMSTNDWYEGFRRGAEVCKASGLREMWQVPTSLLVGSGTEEFPVTEGGHYSADPALMMPQSLNAVDVAPSDRAAPNPPIPNSRPITTDADDVESQAPSDTDDSSNPDTSDQVDEADSQGITLPGLDSDPEESNDPFGNDPLPTTLAPETEPEESGDVFEIPEGAFESGESFEPKDDDFFDLQGSRSRKGSNAPLTIRSVQPVSKIPEQSRNARDASPIVLTSGEGDLPPPPVGTPLIMSTDSPGPPPPPQRSLPQGRPRMSMSRGANASALLGPSRVSEPRPIVREPQRTASRPAPMKLDAPGASEKPQHDLSNMMPFDVPALEMSAKHPPQSSPPISTTPSPPEQDSPVIVWLDDDVPAQPEPIPNATPDTYVIGSDEWEPFAPEEAESIEYGATNYESVLNEGAMQRSTQWNPQRSTELPLRVGDELGSGASVSKSPRNSRMVIQPATKPSTNRTLKFGDPGKSRAIPRIYMQQPAMQTIQPAMESSTLSDESATSFRFRN